MHAQDVSTRGATAADALTISNGRTFVAIANGGADGDRVVNSGIYEVMNGQLVLVSDIQCRLQIVKYSLRWGHSLVGDVE